MFLLSLSNVMGPHLLEINTMHHHMRGSNSQKVAMLIKLDSFFYSFEI
jgi:hypothetical protein